jgi:hypothetical protein
LIVTLRSECLLWNSQTLMCSLGKMLDIDRHLADLSIASIEVCSLV